MMYGMPYHASIDVHIAKFERLFTSVYATLLI